MQAFFWTTVKGTIGVGVIVENNRTLKPNLKNTPAANFAHLEELNLASYPITAPIDFTYKNNNIFINWK